jgi:hypothetical protein
MTTTTMDERPATPWHLWAVGAVALLWNGYGGYDYLMTQVKGAAYLHDKGMTDAQVAVFNATPMWAIGDWAVGVWAGVLGALLLLARSRFAMHAFIVSLAALLIGAVYDFVLSGAGKAYGTPLIVMDVVFAVILAALIGYARAMTKRGVLR